MDKLVKNIEEFIAWTKKLDGRLLLYRGLANSDWEVESSAHRRIKESQGASPSSNSISKLYCSVIGERRFTGFP